jgi:hypothetical protein
MTLGNEPLPTKKHEKVICDFFDLATYFTHIFGRLVKLLLAYSCFNTITHFQCCCSFHSFELTNEAVSVWGIVINHKYHLLKVKETVTQQKGTLKLAVLQSRF